MSKYKFIIFDLDGTLIDPKEGQINSVKYALKSFGINEEDENKLCKFIGPPLKESFKKYYNFNEQQIDIGIQKYREYFMEKGIKEAVLYNGITTMLNTLKENGKKIIIATSNPTSFAKQIARMYKIDNYLFDICGSKLDGSRVTKSEILSYVIDKHKIKNKNEAIMVGDRIHDILGAQGIKIDSVGVLYGYGMKEEIDEAKPTYKVNTVQELEDLLK